MAESMSSLPLRRFPLASRVVMPSARIDSSCVCRRISRRSAMPSYSCELEPTPRSAADRPAASVSEVPIIAANLAFDRPNSSALTTVLSKASFTPSSDSLAISANSRKSAPERTSCKRPSSCFTLSAMSCTSLAMPCVVPAIWSFASFRPEIRPSIFAIRSTLIWSSAIGSPHHARIARLLDAEHAHELLRLPPLLVGRDGGSRRCTGPRPSLRRLVAEHRADDEQHPVRRGLRLPVLKQRLDRGDVQFPPDVVPRPAGPGADARG